MSSERGDITKGKYYVCDPEQGDFLKAVSQGGFKDFIITGNFFKLPPNYVNSFSQTFKE